MIRTEVKAVSTVYPTGDRYACTRMKSIRAELINMKPDPKPLIAECLKHENARQSNSRPARVQSVAESDGDGRSFITELLVLSCSHHDLLRL